jgi:Helix-turn-helix domain
VTTNGRHMPGLMVTGGVVVLTGEWLEIALNSVMVADRNRRLNRMPDSEAHRLLAAALRRAVSVCPSGDSPKRVGAQTNTRWLTAQDAAELLGCDERTVTRKARQLDGQKIRGRWHIPETAVLEHIGGRTT